MSSLPLPSVADFTGLPLTREACAAAQAAVNQLRAHAHHLRQYVILWDEGANVRAYYGESGQALANAEDIKALFNRNLYMRYPYQHGFTHAEVDRLIIR